MRRPIPFAGAALLAGLFAGTAVLIAAGAASAQPAPARGGARPAPPAAAQPPAPPPIFPCRKASEVCHLAVVLNGKALVLFSNAPNAAEIGDKPIDVAGPGGAALDLAPHEGRVVMLTGSYEKASGLKEAELVEVAGPLASLLVKLQLAGPPEDAKPQPGPTPARRR